MSTSTPRTVLGQTTFVVNGMTCAHCKRALTEEIGTIDGIETVDVDVAGGTVSVTVRRPVDVADIARAVDEAGYTLLR